MRLPQPFVRIPIHVDAAALAREIDAIEPAAWRAHPQSAPGNTALPLVAADGDPNDDAVEGPMRATAHLAVLPYTVRVLSALDSVIGRTRLMRIEEEGELFRHVDAAYYWWEHVRIHVPVVTSPEVLFECGGERVHMAAGEVWAVDTWRPHSVVNPSSAPRTHLVADTVGSALLWDLIEHPERDSITVPTDGPDVTVLTESVNVPSVMTPWEVDHIVATLLDDATESAPGAHVAGIAHALLPWQRSWRMLWAAYGASDAGLASFEALRQRGRALAQAIPDDVRLANGLALRSALTQLLLDPALDRHRLEAAARTVPREPSAPPAADVVIERPIFVVSAPRSGSTLLFETLAQAPDLMTIGGESHRLIEQVPGLHPAALGWESNRLTASDATPEVVAALRHAFATQLRDRDGLAAAGRVRMLEKTPKNALRVPFLAAAFPDAVFVSLHRDPRETLSSMIEAWRSGGFRTYPALPGWTNELPWSLLLTPGWRELVDRPLHEIVASQWSTTVTALLDDLGELDPDRWCIASYDQLVADPATEIARICAFCDLAWDTALDGPLPLARHTVDSPRPEKWRRNAEAIESVWPQVEPVAARALDVFAARPRIDPVLSAATATRRPTRAATREPDDIEPIAAHRIAEAGAESFGSTHAGPFAEVLARVGSSLVVSTYQSGRLVVVRTDGETVNTHFRSMKVPMGIAASGNRLAVGTKHAIEVFQDQPAVARHLDGATPHDAVYMPRRTHVTGDLRIHDLAWAGRELWAVNTRFSCLVTFDDDHSFVPRWRPPFIRALTPEDRCHLNGLAVIDGAPRFVTALGVTDQPDGWRDGKSYGGVVLDVASGETVATGLCMPHSPRWHDGRLWVLESGTGVLGTIDVERGTLEEVARVPGFARGLGFAGQFAFVGLSQVRESLFDGLPLTADGVERTCGVWVIDIRSGETVAFLRFEGAVQELFEVAVLPGIRFPEIVEPGAELVDSSYVLPDTAIADVPAELRS